VVRSSLIGDTYAHQDWSATRQVFLLPADEGHHQLHPFHVRDWHGLGGSVSDQRGKKVNWMEMMR
jgi:hypothetical protein